MNQEYLAQSSSQVGNMMIAEYERAGEFAIGISLGLMALVAVASLIGFTLSILRGK